jgi:hypothetical protein
MYLCLCWLDVQDWLRLLPCHGFSFESIVNVWAHKAHCALLCVVSFVSRCLYTWTALHLFSNSFLSCGLIDKLFTQSDTFTIVLSCVILPFVSLNFCGFSRLDTHLHDLWTEVILGGAHHCCIVCASLLFR